MSKILKFFIGLVFIFSLLAIKIPPVYAATAPCPLTILVNGDETTTFPPDFDKEVTLKSDQQCFTTISYRIIAFPQSIGTPYASQYTYKDAVYSTPQVSPKDENTLITTLNIGYSGIGQNNPGKWTLWVCESDCHNQENVRGSATFEVSATPPNPINTPGFEDPIIDIDAQSQCKFEVNTPITINRIKNIQKAPGFYMWWWGGDWPPGKSLPEDGLQYDPTDQTLSFTIPGSANNSWGYRTFCINRTPKMDAHDYNCLNLTITKNEPTGDTSCPKPAPPPECKNDDDCKKKDPDKPICKKEENEKGGKCVAPTLSGGQETPGCNDPPTTDPNDPTKKIPNPNPGIDTAIGCIHTNPAEFVKDLMTFVVGISGGLAFLMMLLGAFQMLTSAGNPETLAAGKSRLTSAVIGLLIVIFAVLLLQIIGFDILKIPGFIK